MNDPMFLEKVTKLSTDCYYETRRQILRSFERRRKPRFFVAKIYSVHLVWKSEYYPPAASKSGDTRSKRRLYTNDNSGVGF